MYDVLLSFITAFIATYFVIPAIIHVAEVKHLFDEPGERRSHSVKTPSLGGIGIFTGIIFAVLYWTPFTVFADLQYMLCAFVIIFLVGVKDDIVPMTPYKKLVGELMSAGILVYAAKLRINSLHGFIGINEIGPEISIPLTIFTIIVIINAFNLIDGINGLSGSISAIICITLGTWFLFTDKIGLAILAFAAAGAVTAFLKYNFTPASIFMGDTGALLLGLISSILIIKFIDINRTMNPESPYFFAAAPAAAIGLLILPLFDTARVFTIRMLNKRSPFSPDRMHIHHLLIDFGFTHMKATAVLASVTVGFIFMSFSLQRIGTFPLLGVILLVAFIGSYALQKAVEHKKSFQKAENA
ncbi:MAG: hypothetical protein RL757_2464 [Bacteroidota bacterium]|jgi:UDP-N-acetylmuramyl pentapeptide phosphotransferase/UDP-N-acetylglucosamine-1-phosphate transferase